MARRLPSESDRHLPLVSAIPLVGVGWSLAAGEPDEVGDSETRAVFGSRVLQLGFQLVLGAVFVGLGWRFSDNARLVLACAYAALLFEIGLVDLDYRLVLNVLSYPGAILALVGSLFWSGIGPKSALLGGLVGLGLFLVVEIVGRGAMGRGDTKLAGLIGLMRGYPGVWTALGAGIVVGGLVALVLLLSGRGRRATFAYGPSLVAGAIISFFVTYRL